MTFNSKQYWFAVLLLSSAQIIWSGNFIAGRMLASSIEPFTLVSLRWTLSIITIGLIFHQSLATDWHLIKSRWPLVLLTGIIGTSLFPVMLYTGLAGSEALNASLFFSSAPVIVLVLSAVLFHERVSVRQAFGVALGVIGVMVIGFQGEFNRLLAFQLRTSDLWVFGALTAWSFYCILQPKVSKGFRPETVILVFAIAGMPLNLIGFGFEYQNVGWPSLGTREWLVILYITFFPSLTAYFLWNSGQNRIGAAEASPYNHVAPVSAACLSFVFLDEPLYLYHIFAAALIIGGVFIFTQSRKP